MLVIAQCAINHAPHAMIIALLIIERMAIFLIINLHNQLPRPFERSRLLTHRRGRHPPRLRKTLACLTIRSNHFTMQMVIMPRLLPLNASSVLVTIPSLFASISSKTWTNRKILFSELSDYISWSPPGGYRVHLRLHRH